MSTTLVEGENVINITMLPIVIETYLIGQVTDADTGQPISGVRVVLSWDFGTPGSGENMTDANGNYEFRDLFPGLYNLGFYKDGYENKEL